MPEIKLPAAFRIDIIESERGWGQKIDESKYFDTEQEAREFVDRYNAEHNPIGPVPDWYMFARYHGRV